MKRERESDAAVAVRILLQKMKRYERFVETVKHHRCIVAELKPYVLLRRSE